MRSCLEAHELTPRDWLLIEEKTLRQMLLSVESGARAETRVQACQRQSEAQEDEVAKLRGALEAERQLRAANEERLLMIGFGLVVIGVLLGITLGSASQVVNEVIDG